MLGCDLAMAAGDRNPTERQLLVVGVDPHRHRCARGPFQTAATEVLYGAHSANDRGDSVVERVQPARMPRDVVRPVPQRAERLSVPRPTLHALPIVSSPFAPSVRRLGFGPHGSST